MWPLLLLILLAGASSKKKGDQGGDQGGDDQGGDDQSCVDAPYDWTGTPLLGLPDLNKYGLTANEKTSLTAVFTAVKGQKVNAFPLWDVCTRMMVEEIAEAPLDEYGALAMLTYWGATKSKKARPYPDNDLEVLQGPAVKVGDTEVPLVTYVKQRLQLFKTAFIAAAVPGQAAKAAFNPPLKAPPHKSGLAKL